MKRRGNVLLMAVFMAVFLFFLSVALVTANRQDILLGLSVGHRLKAQLAARAGTEVGLARLRAEPGAEQSLHGWTQSLASGAHFSLQLETVQGPQTALLRLKSVGSSGFLSSDRSMLLESFDFGAASAGGVPLLVGKAGSQLLGLGPSFRWTELATLPRQDTWLAAGGGPLVVMAPRGTADPPPFLTDWTATAGPYGILSPGTTTVDWGSQAGQHEHLLVLSFQGDQSNWVDVPDPGDLLARSAPATIDGDPNGQPHWDAVVDSMGNIIQFTDSEFVGPRYEWWGLDGPALTSELGVVYCHATHYFYRGLKFQNHVSVQAGEVVNDPEHVPAKLFKEDAVLYADLNQFAQSQKIEWKAAVDLLRVPDQLSEPEVMGGPRPLKSSLSVTGGQVYAFQVDDSRQLLRGALDGWSQAGLSEGLSTGLAAYQSKVRPFGTDGAFEDGTPRIALQGLEPWSQLQARREEVRCEALQDDRFVSLVAEQRLDVTAVLSPGPNNCPALGADLYCVGSVRVARAAPSGTTLDEFLGRDPPQASSQTVQCLLHYDGGTWQAWPSGLQGILGGAGGGLQVVAYDSSGSSREYTLDAGQLALAAYQGSEDRMRRYVPVVLQR